MFCHNAWLADEMFPGLKDFIVCQLSEMNKLEEKSTITTLGVLLECADNIHSLKSILDNRHDLYGIGTQMSWLPVIGDHSDVMAPCGWLPLRRHRSL